MVITRRELDILKFLSNGFSEAQVANVLGVNQRSVANDLKSLWSRLEQNHAQNNRSSDAHLRKPGEGSAR